MPTKLKVKNYSKTAAVTLISVKSECDIVLGQYHIDSLFIKTISHIIDHQIAESMLTPDLPTTILSNPTDQTPIISSKDHTL